MAARVHQIRRDGEVPVVRPGDSAHAQRKTRLQDGRADPVQKVRGQHLEMIEEPRVEAKNGVYILENMDTRALAADEAWEFLFVLGQPKFVGAVQAVINPVAIR